MKMTQVFYVDGAVINRFCGSTTAKEKRRDRVTSVRLELPLSEERKTFIKVQNKRQKVLISTQK